MLTPDSLLKIKSICKTSQGYRQQSDLSYLLTITKEIKLFKDLAQKQGENAHISCCQYLLHEFIPANEYVFRYGEPGSKFYILLSGSVSIEIPVTDSGQVSFTEIMTYTPGSSFGELALETSKPRSASALCKSDCHFLVLMKKAYSQLMQRIVIEKKNEMINFLQSLPPFQKINKLAIMKLTYNIKEVNFTRGQYVFYEGDPAKEIFIVHDGECKLCKGILKPSSSCGIRKVQYRRMHTAKRIGVGSMIAEEDVLNKQPHSYSCICASDLLSLYVIPAADFFMRITAEQPLKYLKKISNEKKSFLENWSSLRNSLDDVFVRSPEKADPINVKKNAIVKFNDIEKLNQAVTERRKLLSRNSATGLEDLWGKVAVTEQRKLLSRNSPAVCSEDAWGKVAGLKSKGYHKKSISTGNLLRIDMSGGGRRDYILRCSSRSTNRGSVKKNSVSGFV